MTDKWRKGESNDTRGENEVYLTQNTYTPNKAIWMSG